jgi:hypothetical protein
VKQTIVLDVKPLKMSKRNSLDDNVFLNTNSYSDGFAHEEIMAMTVDDGRVSNRHLRVSNLSSNNEYKPNK